MLFVSIITRQHEYVVHKSVYQLDNSDNHKPVQCQTFAAQCCSVTASCFLSLDLLYRRYHQQEFGWWRILTVSGGFVAHAPDPAQLQVCIALCNHLPVPIPLTAAAVILVDSKGSWAQELVLGAGPLQQAVAAHEQQHTAAAGHSSTAARQSAADSAAAGLHVLHIATPARAAAAWPAQLQPGSWLVAHAVVTPRTVGNVRVDQLHLQLSDFCNVKFLPTSFPPGHPALGQASLPHGQEPFKVQQGVRQGMWVTKVQHVGRLPDVQVSQSWLALVKLNPKYLLILYTIPSPALIDR